MSEASQRVWVSVELDGEREAMTLDRYREENEAAPGWVALVEQLAIGGRVNIRPGFFVERVEPPKRAPTRWARFSLPWNFDGSKVVTVRLHRDSGAIAFRPRGRKRVTFVDLGKLLEVVASREAKAAALAKKKARRSRK